MRDNGRAAVRTVRVGARRLTYSLRFDDAPRMVISVYPDLTVSVRAPHGADFRQVDARVIRRAPWIHRQLLEFERYHPLPVPRRYVSGETHLYLGRQYRLRVRRGPEVVRLSRPFLLVTLPKPPLPRVVRHMLRAWYWMRAQSVFPRRLTQVLKRAPWLARTEPHLRVREMTTRWGSCGSFGTITLSVELVKAPVACIDYVVAHELCHRLEMGHTRRFYTLLSLVVPEWERARDRLNRAVR